MDKLPTPQQLKAIEHEPAPLMILAGAGTGKTFALIERIVYLIVKEKVDPSDLLVITYTERAAAELRDRTRQLIGSAAQKMTVGTFHAFCYRLVKEFSAVTPPPREPAAGPGSSARPGPASSGPSPFFHNRRSTFV